MRKPRWPMRAARTISTPSRSTRSWPGVRPRQRAVMSPPPAGCTRRRSRFSRTTGGRGTTARGCSRGSPARKWRCSTPSGPRRATRAGWPAPTRRLWLRCRSAQPDLRPEEAERAVDERLREVGGDLAGAVCEEALAVVVEAGDLREAGFFQEALEAAWRVPHLGDVVSVAGIAALEAVFPVRLDEQETAAGAERLAGGCEHEVGPGAVMKGVVEKG